MVSELCNKHTHLEICSGKMTFSLLGKLRISSSPNYITEVLSNKYHIQFLLCLDDLTSESACGHSLSQR